MKAVIVHKRIKKALETLKGKYPQYDGFYIIRVATEAKTDTRTAVHHLEILEENELGRFLDPDHKVFALKQVRV